MEFQPLLEHINQRVKLTSEEESIITSRLKLRTFLKGQFVQQAGDVSRHQYFITSGSTKTFYTDTDGNMHVVAMGIEDWWIGDICSFSNQLPADFHIQCLDQTTVIQIAYSDQEALFDEVPKLERYFRLVVQKAYGNMSLRIVRNHSMSAKERYVLFLKSYPEIVQRVPQYVIASYLGITKEFLSSIRKQLSTEA
ncbi:MAG: Crp/Fnr family transcriptional regulator [Cytophagales bacterium]|nr:Crp/Fnr family transcriptional regulator [Cytophagales bacterium]